MSKLFPREFQKSVTLIASLKLSRLQLDGNASAPATSFVISLGVFKRNNHCHIQWKKYCNGSQNQDSCQNTIYFSCFFHYNCSSFLFKTVIWNTEIATITTKNNTAFALWNPNCPPSIPFL